MATKAPVSEPQPQGVSFVAVGRGSALERALEDASPDLAGAGQLLVVAVDETVDTIKLQSATREAVGLLEQADLEHLVSLLAPEYALPSAAVLEQSRRNLRLREELLREFGSLTAKEVADLAGSEARNRSQFAHALLRSGRVLSVMHRRQQVFPGFQFDADGPLPVVAEVLPVLQSRFRKDWEVALWFTTENYWLDGFRPVDLLIDDESRVIEAARAGADRSGF